MVPNLSRAGTNFKGAFAYHGHDKGRDDTRDRVEWVSTRNLITDDLDRAERVMIATALDADRLKARAGIKATGRKSRTTVQTLSLSWSPDEQVDRVEMERAADQVIERLELQEHQVVMVAHNDTAHRHVHLIINRVHPEDGRMAGLSNSKRTLDRWAHDYEQARGRVVTPKRAEKYQRQEQAKRRYPDAKERRAYAERNEDYQAYRKRVVMERQKHEDARKASTSHRKAEWRDHYKAVRGAEKARRRMERSMTGKLALAITAAREERRSGSTEGMARLTWANLINRSRREAVFASVAERDKSALAARQNFARDKAMERLSERRGQEIEDRKVQHQRERDDLKRQQAGGRQEIRDQWQHLNKQQNRSRNTFARAGAHDLDKENIKKVQERMEKWKSRKALLSLISSQKQKQNV